MAKNQKKIIKPGKAVTAPKVDGLRDKLLKVPEQKIKKLVLDFAKVETVDSVGLGLVLATYNTMKDTGGDLEIINVPEDIYGVFSATGLDRHLEIQSAGG
jgi:anti-anti-sigma factor